MNPNRLLHDPALVALRQAHPQLEEWVARGFMNDPKTGLGYFTGYSYATLYDWDQYFEGLTLLYLGHGPERLQNAVRIFLAHQRADGFIARSVPSTPAHDFEHVKPFLGQIACLVHAATGEHTWVTGELLPGLKAYLDYWLGAMDADGDGLSEWMSAPHTGMDNQHERAGYWRDRVSAGVDLNCYLVRECRAVARLCELAGDGVAAAHYRQVAEARAEAIRTRMWCEEDGVFYDLNCRFDRDAAGQPVRRRFADDPTESNSLFSAAAQLGSSLNHDWASWGRSMKRGNAGFPPWILQKTVAGFMPLWAGVATPHQARRLIAEHLLDPRTFWSPYPVAVQSRDSRWYSPTPHPYDAGCNWRANVWIPTNYMIYHGLRWYGEKTLASTLARRTVELVRQSGPREYFLSETGAGCGLDPFWGWTLLAYFMDYEEGLAETLNDQTGWK